MELDFHERAKAVEALANALEGSLDGATLDRGGSLFIITYEHTTVGKISACSVTVLGDGTVLVSGYAGDHLRTQTSLADPRLMTRVRRAVLRYRELVVKLLLPVRAAHRLVRRRGGHHET